MTDTPFDALTFHRRLNPHLWQHHRLRPEVRLKLLQNAIAFYRFLDLPRLRVTDIILTGSNAAYNYTRLSDVDVHLMVAYGRTSCPQLAGNFFNTKRNLWNKTYNVSVHGHPIELYVEDTADPVVANGVYSILHDEWLTTPSDVPPARDDTAVEHKVKAYADEIDSLLLGEPKIADIDELLRRLHVLRQNGLLSGGEFSIENLTYKVLRNGGDLQRLYDRRIELRDAALSVM